MTAQKKHFLQRIAQRVRPVNVGKASPFMRGLLRSVLGGLVRLAFRPRVEGWENLPHDRPYLLVANHSGGGGAEIFCFAHLWLARFGADRPLTGMAHPLAFFLPVIGWLLRSLGAIPSSYDAAAQAFAEGVPVLIFPGGDHEAFRPIWQAGRVDFGGRRGYARLARRERVPVVPLGITGSHYTLPIFWRSHLLLPWLSGMRLWGIKRYPVTLSHLLALAITCWLLLPVIGLGWTLAVCWLLLAVPIIGMLPVVPWSVRLRIGAPLEPEELFGEAAEDAPVDAAAQRVEAAVQQLLDA